MNKHLFAAPLLAASLVYSSSASALDLAPVVNAINTASQYLSSIFNTGNAKVAGVIESTSKAEMDTMNRSQEGISKTIIKVDQDRANAQAKLDYQAAPDPCVTGAILRHVAALTSVQAKAAASYRRGGGGSYRPSDAALNDLLNNPQPSPGVTAAKALSVHARMFCGQGEQKLGLNGTKICVQPSQLPDADVQADSLFYGAKPTYATYAGPSLSFTPDQVQAAAAYIRNTTDPLPPKLLSKDQANTIEGTTYHSVYLAAKSRIDAADINKRDMLAARTPALESKRLLDAVRNSGGADDLARSSSSFSEATKEKYGFERGVSPLALLDFDVERRYSNMDWFAAIAQASPAAIAREQAHMQALALHLQMQSYYQNGRIIALLSDLVSTQTRAEMDVRLQAQYAKVAERR